MTPPEDADSSSGGNSSPPNGLNTPEEEQSPSGESSTEWSTDSDADLALIVRGTPENYDLKFLILLRIDPERTADPLLDFVPIGSKETEKIENIDLDQPPDELRTTIIDRRARFDKVGSALDSDLVRQKFDGFFKSLIADEGFLDNLKKGTVSEIRERLREDIRREVFPGSETELEVRRVQWKLPRGSEDETGEDESGEGQEEYAEDGSPRKDLSVAPCVNPLRGRSIGRLRPGDILKVRVVGSSVNRLRDDYVEEQSSREEYYSRPLRAKLIELSEGATPQEIDFLVRLGEGVYGKGSVTRDTRVLSNEQLVEGVGPFRTGYGRYLFLVLSFLAIVVGLLLLSL